MQMEMNSGEFYQQRIARLENAKIRIDEIKAKVNGLEREILEIKMLDRLFTFKDEVSRSKKETIYKVDDILFFGELMYQRFPTHKLFTWEEAKQEAKNLQISTYKDWRLPTVDELEKLLTKQSNENAKGDSHYIIKDFLETMPQDSCFWSSTQENELYAWVVDFSKGYDYWRRKTLKYHALYVRNKDNSLE